MVIGWTGHRPDVFREPHLAERGVAELTSVALQRWSDVEFICGAQRGVDQWAAAAGLASGIAVHLVLPTPLVCFTAGWETHDREALQALVERAASVVAVDHRGEQGPLAYDRRNEAIVRRADHLFAVWTGVRRGGTFYTLCAARVRGVPVEATVLPAAASYAVSERGV